MFVCGCTREFQTKSAYNIHRRSCNGVKRYCSNPSCSKILLGYHQKKYCSSRCATIHTAPGRKCSKETRRKISLALGGEGRILPDALKKCRFCDKTVRGQFCNSTCQREFVYQEFVRKWKEGIDSGTRKQGPASFVRRYFLEKYKYKCQKCGWGIEPNPTDNPGKSPLCLHHIDGKRKNNKEDNLEILCPNCHILTKTYGGRNFLYKKGEEMEKEIEKKIKEQRAKWSKEKEIKSLLEKIYLEPVQKEKLKLIVELVRSLGGGLEFFVTEAYRGVVHLSGIPDGKNDVDLVDIRALEEEELIDLEEELDSNVSRYNVTSLGFKYYDNYLS